MLPSGGRALLLVVLILSSNTFSLALTYPRNTIPDLLRRSARNSLYEDVIVAKCQQMTSVPGVYTYFRVEDTQEPEQQVCDLYVIGEPDDVIKIEFIYFNVQCKHNGLVTVLDGWEMNGDYFPSITDHDVSFERRFHGFCSKFVPTDPLVSHQNVAKVQYRVPTVGEGWAARVSFHRNHRPCNVVSTEPSGVFTLMNYGLSRNCSLSILYPVTVKLLSVDVGEERREGITRQLRETGQLHKCHKRNGLDLVEMRTGSSIDPLNTAVVSETCGLDSFTKESDERYLFCDHSIIRLLSSGRYFNSVTINYEHLLLPPAAAIRAKKLCSV